jgi:flagellar hook assembly protein FlgD
MVVYDIVGREIVRLIDSRVEPGYHQVTWNGRDKVGREVPTGIYIARILTPQYTKSIKMVLLK